METSSYELISEIGSQHHLVVNEEGVILFSDDGDELLVYDDLKAKIVRVPSCPVAWKHFGLEIDTTDISTPQHINDNVANIEVKTEEETPQYKSDNDKVANIEEKNERETPHFESQNDKILNIKVKKKWETPQYESQNDKIPNIKVKEEKQTHEYKSNNDKVPNIKVKKEKKIKTEVNDSDTEISIEALGKEALQYFYQKKALREAQLTSKKNGTKQKSPSISKSPVKTEKSLTSHTKIFHENFTVKKFTPEEQLIEFEKRKENKSRYLERLYKCQTCYRGFNLQENYSKHMLCHSVKSKYYCEICRIYLISKSIYHSHVKQHRFQFSCKHCSFQSYHRASAILHARAHAIHLPHSYQTYLKNVVLSHVSRFVCSHCGFAFVNNVGLKLHYKRTHRDCEPVPGDGPRCLKCNIIFANENALLTHCRITHRKAGERQSKLDRLSLQQLSPRLATSTGGNESGSDGGDEIPKVSPFLCYLCGATFASDQHLEDHISSHKNDGTHEYIVSDVNIDGLMQEDEVRTTLHCEHCARVFIDPVLLYRHLHSHKYAMRLKQQTRRPECPKCKMTFSSFSNRWRHMKYVHTEMRPFVCETCNKGFKTEPEVKSHYDHVHLKKPWPKRNRIRGKREDSDSPYRIRGTREDSPYRVMLGDSRAFNMSK